MPKERDPRVMKVAEKLAEIQPYGFDFSKKMPSAADYHAAIIAVNTLDEGEEYEYACMRIRNHDRARMADDLKWCDYKQDVDELVKVLNKASLGGQYYSFVVAKRVKAGEIEF